MDGVTKLYAALVLAQRAIRSVDKDAQNKFAGYTYASSEAMIEEARKALAGAGLAVFCVEHTIRPPAMEAVIEIRSDGKERPSGPHMVSILVSRYRLAHESGEFLDSVLEWPIVPEKGRPSDKATASALTTQLAYYLRDLLLMPRGLDADDDMDHNSRDRGREQNDRDQRGNVTNRKVGQPTPAPVGETAPTKAASTGVVAPSLAPVPPAEPLPGEPGRAVETHADAIDKARRAGHAKAAKWGGYSHDEIKALALSLELCEESTNELTIESWGEIVDYVTAEFKQALNAMFPGTEGKPNEQQRIAVVNELRKQRALSKSGVPEIGPDDVPF